MRFGSHFFTAVYIVAASFELLQNSCMAHLRFSTVKSGKKQLSVMRTPVLNPSHRGVLDEAEQASLLVTRNELYEALGSL